MPLAAAPVLASIIGSGTSVGMGLFGAHKASQAQQAQNQFLQSQMQVQKKQMGLADQLSGYAGNLYNLSQPALGRALSYYQTLATGNRGAVNEANAPAINQMADIYKGAGEQVNRSLTGGARDYAVAEMARQRAGQLSMLPMQARLSGVGGLGSLGLQAGQLGQGYANAAGGALGGAGQTGAYTLGQASNISNTIYDRYAGMGKNLADTFLPYLLQQKDGGKGAGAPGGGGSPMTGSMGTPLAPYGGFQRPPSAQPYYTTGYYPTGQ